LRLLVLIFDFAKSSDQNSCCGTQCRKQAIALGHGVQAAPARAHSMRSKTQNGGLPMFIKITLAIALILGTTSGALAAPKQKHNTNRAHLSDTRAQHGGSVSRAKIAHAKRAHVRTAQKQKHRTNQVFASYESRNWSFGSATSALVMVSSKQSSSRRGDFYNTRAQYTGSALAAAATPKLKHSSNPAYDVYDTRGWYIGSDPDPTVRSMMAMDPAATD
jgi:hypothetical protein